jgi:6-phosphogluconolactonase
MERDSSWELVVGADLADTASSWIAERARTSPFRIALSGGSTPQRVFQRLAGLELDWSAWHVWWGDERQVAPDHPDSNERMAREALLDQVPIPPEQIHPLRSLDTELPDRFDLVLLGMGTDGHTASLFPGDPALEASEPICSVVRPDHPRLTLTYPVLNAASEAAFMLGGADKGPMLRRLLDGDQSLPAARIQAGSVFVICDEAAAEAAGA